MAHRRQKAGVRVSLHRGRGNAPSTVYNPESYGQYTLPTNTMKLQLCIWDLENPQKYQSLIMFPLKRLFSWTCSNTSSIQSKMAPHLAGG